MRDPAAVEVEIRCHCPRCTAAALARENAALRRELEVLSKRHTAVLDERDAALDELCRFGEKLSRIAAAVEG